MKVPMESLLVNPRIAVALRALRDYVAEASRIANEIKPFQISGGPLLPDPNTVPVPPRIAELLAIGETHSPLRFWPADPTTTGYFTGETTEAKARASQILSGLQSLMNTKPNSICIVMGGHNLENVERFGLIPAGNLGDEEYLTRPLYASKNLMIALIESPGGDLAKDRTYHAWVQDGFGQEDLLPDALSDYKGFPPQPANPTPGTPAPSGQPGSAPAAGTPAAATMTPAAPPSASASAIPPATPLQVQPVTSAPVLVQQSAAAPAPVSLVLATQTSNAPAPVASAATPPTPPTPAPTPTTSLVAPPAAPPTPPAPAAAVSATPAQTSGPQPSVSKPARKKPASTAAKHKKK
jgi:hypothetical protein